MATCQHVDREVVLGILVREFGSGIARRESKGKQSALEPHDTPTGTHMRYLYSTTMFSQKSVIAGVSRGGKVWVLGRDLTESMLQVAGSRTKLVSRAYEVHPKI